MSWNCRYINSINEPLGGADIDNERMLTWMQRINGWKPKLFTLSHIPHKYIQFFSRFNRQVAIARMAKNPDLANKYHLKLRDAYATEEQLKDQEAVNQSKTQLINLLDDAEIQLAESDFLAGSAFSMADAMFVPILGRIELLNMENELINSRKHILDYWNRVKKRRSYNTVIGKFFSGWKKYIILCSTYTSVWIRDQFKRY